MSTYRLVELTDCESIAALHVESWRQTYRGILSNDYLDGAIDQDRYAVWTERLLDPAVNQRILLAEEASSLLGFICLFLDEDPIRGTLIDNLHVDPALKGRGIGAGLLREAMHRFISEASGPGYYLGVYEANTSAINFYERMGGTCIGREGRVHIRQDAAGQVWVGGHSVTCIRGSVTL